MAREFAQHVIDMFLADPCQAAVGAWHRGECVDDDLELRSDDTSVGIGQ